MSKGKIVPLGLEQSGVLKTTADSINHGQSVGAALLADAEEHGGLGAHEAGALRLHPGQLILGGQRPFRGRPTPDQWQQLIDSLVARHAAVGFELLAMPQRDLTPEVAALDAAQIRAALQRHVVPAKFAIVKAGDFAAAAKKAAAPAAK